MPFLTAMLPQHRAFKRSHNCKKQNKKTKGPRKPHHKGRPPRCVWFVVAMVIVGSVAFNLFTLMKVPSLQQLEHQLPVVEETEKMTTIQPSEPIVLEAFDPPPEWIPSNVAPHFGGLDHPTKNRPKDSPRSIRLDDDVIYSDERQDLFNTLDALPGQFNEKDDPHQDIAAVCRDTNWGRVPHPNCNNVHSIHMRSGLKYLGKGSYRQAFEYLSEHRRHSNQTAAPTSDDDQLVLKLMILEYKGEFEFDFDLFHQTLLDANIMEAMTSSPYITDIYGYCGSTVALEFLENSVIKEIFHASRSKQLRKSKGLDPSVSHNSLTLDEKLDMAIQFSHALVDLHFYPKGPMMHGDLHSPQWLRVPGTKQYKLNDFNFGYILQWNWEKQRFCGLYLCQNEWYFAPEAFQCHEEGVSDQADTYSLGMTLYGLLTGMWPFWEKGQELGAYNTDGFADYIAKYGPKPKIHPAFFNRTTIEDGLIRAADMAWEFDPTKRATSYDILRYLERVRDRVQSERRQGQT